MEFKLKPFKETLCVPRMANIHYFEFTDDYTTQIDQHPFRELVYVDSGTVQIEAEGFSGHLQNNQLIIHKAGEPHRLSCGKKSTPNIIIIGFECTCEQLDAFSAQACTLSGELQRLLTDVVREGRSVFLPPYDQPGTTDMKKRENPPFGADQLIRLKLETFLIELIRRQESAQDKASDGRIHTKILNVYEYLNNNYRENINLNELCFLYSTNKTTLCRQFKAAYGVTVVDYIHALRIRDAKKLLRSGEYNITQIADMLGFSSVHYFSRLFKQTTRLSPSEYIKTIKSKLEV